MPKPGARLALVPAIVAAALVLSLPAEPATPRPKLDLSTKKPQLHAGFASVLFWRVHIEDRSGDLAGLEPRFVVGPPGSAERVRSGVLTEMGPSEYFSTHYRPSSVQGRWERQGKSASYDGLFAVEARPGTVEVFQFALTLDRGGDLDRSVAMLPLGARLCGIEAGKLIYLGTLRVTAERTDPKARLFRFQLEPGDSDLPRDLEMMRKLFPAPLASLPTEPETPCGAFGALTSSGEVDR